MFSYNFNCHMCLVHDYSTDPTQMLKGQQEAADWLGIISGINRCVCVGVCVRACVCVHIPLIPTMACNSTKGRVVLNY